MTLHELAPGAYVYLQADGFEHAAGIHRIVSVRRKYIKVQKNRNEPFKLKHARLAALWVPGHAPTFSDSDGVLSAMGYHVGTIQGVRAQLRRQRLERVMIQVPLPAVRGTDEWGPPSSPARPQKLVNCLATFAQNARRRENPPVEAINDWENDLDWIFERYGGQIAIDAPEVDPDSSFVPYKTH